MFKTKNDLPEATREKAVELLNARLADSDDTCPFDRPFREHLLVRKDRRTRPERPRVEKVIAPRRPDGGGR